MSSNLTTSASPAAATASATAHLQPSAPTSRAGRKAAPEAPPCSATVAASPSASHPTPPTSLPCQHCSARVARPPAPQAPEVAGLFEGLKGGPAEIAASPALEAYYLCLRMRVVGAAAACAAVASGMVANVGGGGRVADLVERGVQAVQHLAENSGLPFAAFAAKLLTGAGGAYVERDKKRRVDRVLAAFPTPTRADAAAEAVARAAALRKRDVLEAPGDAAPAAGVLARIRAAVDPSRAASKSNLFAQKELLAPARF